eukprot:TRINITY_DN6001_c0_g2_i1.p2 TRINITY_DN6001_c0_g2~~TRINITY_DN6001_c0_g2_i1.p2  ORF type:complete len:104 (-),score=4.43 TRINITY_DN6001_c0_g2_i1:53-364(-)
MNLTLYSIPYLVEGDELAVGVLDLLLLAHEGPESGLGDDGVGGKHAHAVNLGLGLGVTGLCAAHHQVLSHPLLRVLRLGLLSHGRSLVSPCTCLLYTSPSPRD